jgi:protocatechuate 3,4-dioxygenase beta subunit
VEIWDDHRLTRRGFARVSAALTVPILLGGCDGKDEEEARGPTSQRAPTPACDDGDEPTPSLTEGPFFTPDSPERRSLLERGVAGTPLVVRGRVLTAECRPVRRALLDFWQADGRGEYDNEGYRLRGHQFTDARGRYLLRTVVPGEYPGRTRHIHVKAQAPRGELLTTQLFFPGQARNEEDPIFDPALVMDVRGGRAAFDFVVNT